MNPAHSEPYPHIIKCPDPETCTEWHNEDIGQGEHHYQCECERCMYVYWTLKH